jgi:hypothetical protein
MYRVCIISLGTYYLIGTHTCKRTAEQQVKAEQARIRNSGETVICVTGTELNKLEKLGVVWLG